MFIFIPTVYLLGAEIQKMTISLVESLYTSLNGIRMKQGKLIVLTFILMYLVRLITEIIT
jgi:hypothetical protein